MWQNILFNAIPCLRYVLQAMLSLGMQYRSFHKDTRYFFSGFTKCVGIFCASLHVGMQDIPPSLNPLIKQTSKLPKRATEGLSYALKNINPFLN